MWTYFLFQFTCMEYYSHLFVLCSIFKFMEDHISHSVRLDLTFHVEILKRGRHAYHVWNCISVSISKIVLDCLGKSFMCTFSHLIDIYPLFLWMKENSLSVFWSPRCRTRFDSFNRCTHFGIMWNWLHVRQKFNCLIRLSLSTYENHNFRLTSVVNLEFWKWEVNRLLLGCNFFS